MSALSLACDMETLYADDDSGSDTGAHLDDGDPPLHPKARLPAALADANGRRRLGFSWRDMQAGDGEGRFVRRSRRRRRVSDGDSAPGVVLKERGIEAGGTYMYQTCLCPEYGRKDV